MKIHKTDILNREDGTCLVEIWWYDPNTDNYDLETHISLNRKDAKLFVLGRVADNQNETAHPYKYKSA